jgi:hypothetical protein
MGAPAGGLIPPKKSDKSLCGATGRAARGRSAAGGGRTAAAPLVEAVSRRRRHGRVQARGAGVAVGVVEAGGRRGHGPRQRGGQGPRRARLWRRARRPRIHHRAARGRVPHPPPARQLRVRSAPRPQPRRRPASPIAARSRSGGRAPAVGFASPNIAVDETFCRRGATGQAWYYFGCGYTNALRNGWDDVASREVGGVRVPKLAAGADRVRATLDLDAGEVRGALPLPASPPCPCL